MDMETQTIPKTERFKVDRGCYIYALRPQLTTVCRARLLIDAAESE